jgi:hypothetical protein
VPDIITGCAAVGRRRMIGLAGARPGRPTTGAAMPTIIAHHDVTDTQHWLASPKREEFFGPRGVTNIRTFVDPQNPTHVALLMDVPDLDALIAGLETEAAAEAIAHDGVVKESITLLVES